MRTFLPSSSRIIMVNANRKSQLITFFANHEQLGHGSSHADTVALKLALLGDPDDGSIVRAYATQWHLPNTWWLWIKDFLDGTNWVINSPMPNNDLSHYNAASWTWAEALADVTKKRFPLKVVPVEPTD